MATTAAKQNKPNQSRENSGQSSTGQSANDITKELAEDYHEMREDFQTLIDEVGSSVSTYCRKRPGMAACVLFTLGFYVGWKIKPW